MVDRSVAFAGALPENADAIHDDVAAIDEVEPVLRLEESFESRATPFAAGRDIG
jgi:hypothetical protein